MFIDDLPDNIDSRTRLFADDYILYWQILSDNDQHLLQEGLDRLVTWEKTWGMEFHPQNCSVLWISRARTFQYQLKGVLLAEELSSKYLGVIMQSSLSWKNQIYKPCHQKIQQHARLPTAQLRLESELRNQCPCLLHHGTF